MVDYHDGDGGDLSGILASFPLASSTRQVSGDGRYFFVCDRQLEYDSAQPGVLWLLWNLYRSPRCDPRR